MYSLHYHKKFHKKQTNIYILCIIICEDNEQTNKHNEHSYWTQFKFSMSYKYI